MTTILLPFQTSVPFSEVHQTRSEVFTRDGQAGALALMCDWASRRDLARDVIGYTEEQANGTSLRRLPMLLPGTTNIYAVKCAIEPVGKVLPDGGNTRIASYSMARLNLEFAFVDVTFGGNNESGATATESIEGSAEFLRMPAERLYWDGDQEDPVSDAESPGKIVRTADWVVSIDETNAIPNGLLGYEGTVNNAAVTSARLGFTFAEETLLFQTPRLRRKLTSSQGVGWSLEMKLTYRSTGWNKFYRSKLDPADGGVWIPKPMYDENGNELKTYTPVDFSPILGLFL